MGEKQNLLDFFHNILIIVRCKRVPNHCCKVFQSGDTLLHKKICFPFQLTSTYFGYDNCPLLVMCVCVRMCLRFIPKCLFINHLMFIHIGLRKQVSRHWPTQTHTQVRVASRWHTNTSVGVWGSLCVRPLSVWVQKLVLAFRFLIVWWKYKLNNTNLCCCNCVSRAKSLPASDISSLQPESLAYITTCSILWAVDGDFGHQVIL